MMGAGTGGFEAAVSDPCGFLAKAPQLAALASKDRQVAAAITKGDAFALHRALEKMQKTVRAGSQEWMSLVALLRDRRLFLRGASPPTLFRLNTLGTALFFEHDTNEDDGSYIGTQCFSALFAPLVPLSQYLVQRAPEGGWYFLGQVPLSEGMRLWRRIVGGVFAASLLFFLVAGAVGASQQPGAAGLEGLAFGPSLQKVFIVNALDVPVRVEVDGVPAKGEAPSAPRELFVGPGDKQTVEVERGVRTFKTFSVEGAALEEVKLDVTKAQDFAAYSVLGAAPLFAEGVHYGDIAKLPPNFVEEYAGEKAITRETAPYLFVDPPKTVTLGTYEKRRTLWTIGLDDQGWKQTARTLRFLGKRKEAGALVAQVTLIDPTAVDEVWVAAGDLAVGAGVAAALEYARKADAAYPNDSYVTELLLTYLQGAGLEEEARTLFTERAASAPDDWRLQWLAARALEPRESAKAFAALIAKHPGESLLARSYAGLLRRMGDHKGSLAHHEKARSLGSADRTVDVSDQLRSMVSLGWVQQAYAFGEKHAAVVPLIDWELAIDSARIAILAGKPRITARALFDEYLLESKMVAADTALFDALTQLNPVDADMLSRITHAPTREAVTLSATVTTDLDKALTLGRKAPSDVVGRVGMDLVVLLGCEYARLGETEVATRYFENDAGSARARPALEAFIRDGTKLPLWDNIRPEFRAAAMLSRARKLGSGKEADALIAAAKRDDPLRGAVALAAEAWAARPAVVLDTP